MYESQTINELETMFKEHHSGKIKITVGYNEVNVELYGNSKEVILDHLRLGRGIEPLLSLSNGEYEYEPETGKIVKLYQPAVFTIIRPRKN